MASIVKCGPCGLMLSMCLEEQIWVSASLHILMLCIFLQMHADHYKYIINTILLFLCKTTERHLDSLSYKCPTTKTSEMPDGF